MRPVPDAALAARKLSDAKLLRQVIFDWINGWALNRDDEDDGLRGELGERCVQCRAGSGVSYFGTHAALRDMEQRHPLTQPEVMELAKAIRSEGDMFVRFDAFVETRSAEESFNGPR